MRTMHLILTLNKKGSGRNTYVRTHYPELGKTTPYKMTSDVRKAINETKSNKARGEDMKTAEHFKYLND